jgi:hypothetical protein
MFAAFPLLALPVLVYNLIVLTLAGGFNANAPSTGWPSSCSRST